MRHRRDTIIWCLLFTVFFIIVLITLSKLVCGDSWAMPVEDGPGPVRTAKQDALHEAAELLRAAGYTDTDEPILALQAAWAREQGDLDILAKVIEYEAGDCPWDHKVAVAAVVLNRVASPAFPDSVYDVVGQPGQYHSMYLSGFSGVRRSSYEAARAAMDGNHDVPADVFWQAQFPQGKSIWWVSYVNTGWYSSTTFFCRGLPYGEG